MNVYLLIAESDTEFEIVSCDYTAEDAVKRLPLDGKYLVDATEVWLEPMFVGMLADESDAGGSILVGMFNGGTWDWPGLKKKEEKKRTGIERPTRPEIHAAIAAITERNVRPDHVVIPTPAQVERVSPGTHATARTMSELLRQHYAVDFEQRTREALEQRSPFWGMLCGSAPRLGLVRGIHPGSAIVDDIPDPSQPPEQIRAVGGGFQAVSDPACPPDQAFFMNSRDVANRWNGSDAPERVFEPEFLEPPRTPQTLPEAIAPRHVTRTIGMPVEAPRPSPRVNRETMRQMAQAFQSDVADAPVMVREGNGRGVRTLQEHITNGSILNMDEGGRDAGDE